MNALGGKRSSYYASVIATTFVRGVGYSSYTSSLFNIHVIFVHKHIVSHEFKVTCNIESLAPCSFLLTPPSTFLALIASTPQPVLPLKL